VKLVVVVLPAFSVEPDCSFSPARGGEVARRADEGELFARASRKQPRRPCALAARQSLLLRPALLQVRATPQPIVFAAHQAAVVAASRKAPVRSIRR